jgi:hypothetical protein
MDVQAIIFMANFGKFISLMKAAYLCRRENGDLNNSPRDDIDQMMDNMANSDKISFVSLSDVPIKTPLMSLTLTAMWIQSLYQQQVIPWSCTL